MSAARAADRGTQARAKARVLFLCTGNSARSQIAEALLRHRAGERFDVHSAGLEPKPIHPLAHRVMGELGIDTSVQTSKSPHLYLGRVHFHHAIVLCAHAESRCPTTFPFAHEHHYWPFDDPAAVGGPEEGRLRAFREVRDAIDARIRAWLSKAENARA